MVLNMLTTAAMIRMGHVYGNTMVNVHLKNAKLRERGLTILEKALNIGRSQAQRALRSSGYNLKVAIVMHRTNLNRAQAAALLKRQGGRIA